MRQRAIIDGSESGESGGTKWLTEVKAEHLRLMES